MAQSADLPKVEHWIKVEQDFRESIIVKQHTYEDRTATHEQAEAAHLCTKMYDSRRETVA